MTKKHWVYQHLSEVFALGISMATFAYTGALNPDIGAGMVCVAVVSYVIRRLL